MTTSLFVSIPNTADATSFYRGIGPLSLLRKQMPELNLIFAPDLNWPTVSMLDAAFLQRPYTKSHLQMAEMIKDMERPLWVDYDDNLFDLPTDNPAFPIYMTEATQQNIAKIIAMADVVTVSTKELKRVFQLPKSPLNERVYVVPNALNDDLHFRRVKAEKHKLICWRGSNTHHRDLMEFTPQIMALAERYKDWTWAFVGYNPWWLTDRLGKRAVVVEPLDVIEYHRFMAKTRPAIQIVPLADSAFNHCKSNIAYIEAARVGGVTVAPDWEEWAAPGTLSYKSPDDFGLLLQSLMEGPDWGFLEKLSNMSWDHVWETRLSQRNLKRIEIVKALTGKEPWPEGGAPSGEEPGVMVLD